MRMGRHLGRGAARPVHEASKKVHRQSVRKKVESECDYLTLRALPVASSIPCTTINKSSAYSLPRSLPPSLARSLSLSLSLSLSFFRQGSLSLSHSLTHSLTHSTCMCIYTCTDLHRYARLYMHSTRAWIWPCDPPASRSRRGFAGLPTLHDHRGEGLGLCVPQLQQ